MSQNIIDLSWDLAKFEAEKQKLIAGMQEVYTKASAFTELKIAPGSTGGYTELIGKTKEFNSAKSDQINLQKKQEQLDQARLRTLKLKADADAAQLKATKEQERAEQQRLKTQSAQLDLTKKQATENERIAKSYDPSKVPFVVKGGNNEELANATILVNNLDKEQAAAAISATEFGNSINKSTTAMNTQKVVSKQTAAEIARDAELKKQSESQANAELRNSVREQLAAKGSIEQRRAALIRLNAAYDKLSADERNSPYGVRLQKTISGVTTQVKELESATGRAQRNVGNYASALDKFGSRVETAFRRILAYVTIFAAARFFKDVVTETTEAEDAIERFKVTLENLGRSDAFARLQTKAKEFTDRFKYLDEKDVIGVFEQLVNYGKLTENQITKLLPVITNFAAKQRISIEEATPIIVRALEGQSRGLKQYGIDIKDAHSVTERLGVVMDDLGPKVEGAADAFGQTTQGKIASTKEDFKKLKEEIGNGLLPTINKLLDGVDRLINKFRTMKSDIDFNPDQSGFAKLLSKIQNFISKNTPDEDKINGALERMKALKYGPHQVQESGPGIADYILPADTNPDGNKILGLGGKNQDTQKGVSENLLDEFRKKDLAAIAKYSDDQLKILQDMYKSQIDDQNESYNDRIRAAQRFYDISNQLLTNQKKSEEDALKLEVSTADRKAGKIKNPKLKAETEAAIEKYRVDKLREIDQTFQNNSLKNDQTFYTDKVRISNEAFEKIKKEAEEATKFILAQQSKAYQNQKDQIDINKDNQLIDLEKNYKGGSLKDLETFNAKKKAIEDASDLQQKQLELKRVQVAEKVTEALYGVQNLTFIKQAKDLEFSIAEDGNKKILDGQKALLEAKKQLQQEEYDLLNKGMETAKEFVDASFDRKKEQYAKEEKLLDDNTKKQIDAINASTLSQQEKATQEKQINEAAAVQKKQLEDKQKQEDIKKAKFDKEMAVLNITVTTAETVAKITAEAALLAANPITLAAAPLALAQIPVVIATGAVEIAAVMARPIPTYAKGTDNHKGGPAIVGEGQYMELVTEPSGKSFVASKPMLLNDLPKGSKVKPLANPIDSINHSMYNLMITKTAEMLHAKESSNSNERVIDAIYEGSRMTVQAMKKQKGTNVVVNVSTEWASYIRKNVIE